MIGGMGFGLAAILSSSPLADLSIKQSASGSSGVSKHHENINAAFQELWQASPERLRWILLGSHEIEEITCCKSAKYSRVLHGFADAGHVSDGLCVQIS